MLKKIRFVEGDVMDLAPFADGSDSWSDPKLFVGYFLQEKPQCFEIVDPTDSQRRLHFSQPEVLARFAGMGMQIQKAFLNALRKLMEAQDSNSIRLKVRKNALCVLIHCTQIDNVISIKEVMA